MSSNNNNDNNSSTTLVKTIGLDTITHDVASTKAIDKEEYFKFLKIPLASYDLELDPTTAERFKNSMISLRTGLHARVPMICPGGIKCPVGRQCGLTRFVMDKKTNKPQRGHDSLPVIDTANSKWPVFEQCPYENTLIAMKVQDLCMEFNVDPSDSNNVTDMSIISKLAELDIYDARASQILAKEAIIMDEVATIIINPRTDDPGTEITNKRLHPAFELKEKIHRMKQELIRAMIGDRQSKVKAQAALGTSRQNELTEVMADLARRLQERDDFIEAEVVEVLDDEEDDTLE